MREWIRRRKRMMGERRIDNGEDKRMRIKGQKDSEWGNKVRKEINEDRNGCGC